MGRGAELEKGGGGGSETKGRKWGGGVEGLGSETRGTAAKPLHSHKSHRPTKRGLGEAPRIATNSGLSDLHCGPHIYNIYSRLRRSSAGRRTRRRSHGPTVLPYNKCYNSTHWQARKPSHRGGGAGGAPHRPVPRSHPHRQMRLRATQFAQWPLEWPARRVPALRAAVANGHSAAAGTAAKNIAPLAGSRALRTTACGAAFRPRRRMLAAAAAAAGAGASCSLLASGSAVVHLAADDTASRPARLPVWPEDSRERWAYPSPYDAEAPEGPPRERFKGNEDFFDRR